MSDTGKKTSSDRVDATTIGSLSGAGGSGLARSHARLPSIRPKQDLTLGKVQKKTFAPTIPTSRRIKKEPVDHDVDSTTAKNSFKGKRIPDKKGRKKERKEVISSESVFSMGPVAKSAQGRTLSTYTSSGTSKGLDLIKRRPNTTKSMESDVIMKLPKEEESEEENVAEPLHNQKVEDLFSHSLLPPIQLPLDHTSIRSTSQHISLPTKKLKPIKEELPVEDKLMDVDESEIKPSKGHHVTTAADLFTDDTADSNYFFLQLPDHLPIAVDTTTTEKARTNTLPAVPEGHIGKLNIHKSGKVRLLLGGVSLDINLGTPCGFLQEMVSIRPSHPDFRMTVMGKLSHRLMCTPDFEDILTSVDS